MARALQENLEIRQAREGEGGEVCAVQSKIEGFLSEDLCLTWGEKKGERK